MKVVFFLLPETIEDKEEPTGRLIGKKLKTPSSVRVIYKFTILMSIGIGPGEVMLTGGRSSFRCSFKFSNVICNYLFI